MILKKIAITAAATGIMLASAAGAFAYNHSNGGSTFTNDSYNTSTRTSYNTSTKTVVVTKADVSNHAFVSNDVVTVAKIGGNNAGVLGGNTTTGNTTSGEAEKGGASGAATGGTALGGASNTIATGNAGATSVLTNVVNPTMIRF